jgi:heat-inducible transcriptional repressor
MQEYHLSEREKAILRYVIHQFILTASPVGSRNISKRYGLGLSPATIRNIMADLEESGFLGHPHTSAGRVPTDKGYRYYVDSLMEPPLLSESEKRYIRKKIKEATTDTEETLKITSSILSEITDLLACVTYPKFENSVLHKIQIVRVSSNRILVILTITSGLIRTITFEIDNKIKSEKIEAVQKALNQRLAGLTFKEIRNTFRDRLKDYLKEDLKPIIRLFIDSADKIFTDFKSIEKSVITGAKNILKQPEFESHDSFQSIIELIEEREVIVHIMDEKLVSEKKDFTISIGSELNDEKLSAYSLVAKEYSIGGAKGTVGIIGPKRMQYSKAVAAVIYIAQQLQRELQKTK